MNPAVDWLHRSTLSTAKIGSRSNASTSASAKLFPFFLAHCAALDFATLLLPRVANTCYSAATPPIKWNPTSFWPNVKCRAHFVDFATSVPFATFDRYPAASLIFATWRCRPQLLALCQFPVFLMTFMKNWKFVLATLFVYFLIDCYSCY